MLAYVTGRFPEEMTAGKNAQEWKHGFVTDAATIMFHNIQSSDAELENTRPQPMKAFTNHSYTEGCCSVGYCPAMLTGDGVI